MLDKIFKCYLLFASYESLALDRPKFALIEVSLEALLVLIQETVGASFFNVVAALSVIVQPFFNCLGEAVIEGRAVDSFEVATFFVIL